MIETEEKLRRAEGIMAVALEVVKTVVDKAQNRQDGLAALEAASRIVGTFHASFREGVREDS